LASVCPGGDCGIELSCAIAAAARNAEIASALAAKQGRNFIADSKFSGIVATGTAGGCPCSGRFLDWGIYLGQRIAREIGM
jgi:hypothetical protein